MEDIAVVESGGRYAYQNLDAGTPETYPLDFHSPYGCSKGAADQYVLDYSRIYGIRSSVFRQSCIYGPRQFGVEDQGWVAWFTIASMLGKPITIYGDGKQVRDILHVDDLVLAYEKAFNTLEVVNGQAFNIGGGPGNVLSLLDLIALIELELGKAIPLKFDDWRPGDQKVFVCDIGKASCSLEWAPQVGATEGVRRLCAWVGDNRELLGRHFANANMHSR